MTLNEGIRVGEVETCLLCGEEGLPLYHGMRDRLFSAAGVWGFLQCPQCGLVWLDPRPCREDLGKIYEGYYTHTGEGTNGRLAGVREKLRRTVFSVVAGSGSVVQGWRWKLAARILSRVPPIREMARLGTMCLDGSRQGKLLDVGCGGGQFLALMRDFGWEVLGVEPDVEAAKLAKERFRVPVLVGTLDKAGLLDESFDAVSLNHVIEHVHDPIELLRECRRVVKPAGRVVVLTPNIESVGHRLFRDCWRDLDPPRHFYLFSMSTLAECAERSGFEIRVLRTSSRWARHIWATSRALKRTSGGNGLARRLQHKAEGLAFHLVEGAVRPFWPRAGEELVLVAGKEAAVAGYPKEDKTRGQHNGPTAPSSVYCLGYG